LDKEFRAMRFLLLVVFIPLLLIPVAAVALHVMACGLHVTSVEGLLEKNSSIDRRGRFYGYCKFMAAPLSYIV
jgi:hypothetical protein